MYCVYGSTYSPSLVNDLWLHFTSRRGVKYYDLCAGLSVCESVRLHISKTHIAILHEVLCTYFLWLWLSPLLTTMQ